VPDWFDEDSEVLTLPAGVSLPAANLRIAASTIRYMPDGIMWHFYEKHTNDHYETATVPWSFLQTAARQQGNARAKISH